MSLVTGGGSSFIAPLLNRNAADSGNKVGVNVNYQVIGSTGGIYQINARTIDFAMTEQPLSDEDLKKNGLLQVPVAAGYVSVVLNVAGIKYGMLTLDGSTLANIFMGKIQKWNDAAIQNLNKSIKLPDLSINVIHRGDGSGTTYAFTSYLCTVSEKWSSDYGKGTSIRWPVGDAGKGNEGVAASVQHTNGAITYMEHAYADSNHIPITNILSANGKVLQPSTASVGLALDSIDWSKGIIQSLIPTKNDAAWPISSCSYLLMQKTANTRSKSVVNFIKYFLDNTDLMQSLKYCPLSAQLVDQVQKELNTLG